MLYPTELRARYRSVSVLEWPTVAQPDRREVTYVARGQATDAESLGERDDRCIHKPAESRTAPSYQDRNTRKCPGV